MPEGAKQVRTFLRDSLAEGSAKRHYAQYWHTHWILLCQCPWCRSKSIPPQHERRATWLYGAVGQTGSQTRGVFL